MERLFGYRRVSKVNIYRMNEFEDYYYGYMVPDSGYLKNFALHLYDEGFVLQMPFRKEPDVVPAFEPREKLFQVLKSSVQWGDLQNIETVGALNDMVTKYDMREIVLVQEAYQERQIAQIAAQIAAKPETKLVMIAGPSSSGKTTFSHRLSIQLRTQGMRPHPIAVDNYFVDREKTPRDEDDNYNFECLEAIEPGPYRALLAMGVHPVPAVFHSVLPQIAPAFCSAVLYRFDVNIREASVLGLVGAGGIGAPLIFATNQYDWNKAGAILLGLIMLVWGVDILSSRR